MSTIQTQAALIHLESGLSLSSGIQLDAQEDTFTSLVMEQDNVDTPVPPGDVQVPRQVMLKFLKGDVLLVGFGSDFWPMRLAVEGETILIRLDVETSSHEISTIVCEADINRSLSGTWFDIFEPAGRIRVWFNLDGAKATGSIIYNTPVDDDTVKIDTLTFTKAPTGDALVTFSTITELVDLINDQCSTVSAGEASGVINLTAVVTSASGNQIPLSTTSASMVVVPFSGGLNGSVTPTDPDDGRLLIVPIIQNANADAIAGMLANAINMDPADTLDVAVAGHVLTVTNKTLGTCPPLVDGGDTGFEMSREIIAISPPSVHIKSMGNTTVAVAVAPL